VTRNTMSRMTGCRGVIGPVPQPLWMIGTM